MKRYTTKIISISLALATTWLPAQLNAQEVKACPCQKVNAADRTVQTNEITTIITKELLGKALKEIGSGQLAKLRFYSLKEVPGNSGRNFRLRVIPGDTLTYSLNRGAKLIVNPCQVTKELLVSLDTKRSASQMPYSDSSLLARVAFKSAVRQSEIGYRDMLIRLAQLEDGCDGMKPFFDRLNKTYKLNLITSGRRINADTLANQIYRAKVPFYREVYFQYLAKYASDKDSITPEFQQAVATLLQNKKHTAFSSYDTRRKFLKTKVFARGSFEYADFYFPVVTASEGGNGKSLLRVKLDEVKWAMGYGIYYELSTYVCVPQGSYIGKTGVSFADGQAYLDMSEHLSDLNGMALYDHWPLMRKDKSLSLDSFTGIMMPQTNVNIPHLGINEGNVRAYNFLIGGNSASFSFALPINHVKGKKVHLQNGFKEYKTTLDDLEKKFRNMGFQTVRVTTDEPYDEKRAKYVRVYLRYEM